MKKPNTRLTLKIANAAWALITISGFFFKSIDAETQQRTIIIWTLFLVVSIIYNKLDDMEIMHLIQAHPELKKYFKEYNKEYGHG